MINYGLPTTIELSGQEYGIRSDYRAVLDICTALCDINLNDSEKAIVTCEILYPEYKKIKDLEEATEKAFEFINLGQPVTDQKPKPALMNWEQDFNLIVPAINKVTGQEIRSIPYMHWWTFVAAYMEIGECLFSNVIGIRQKRAKGKKLEKYEQEFMNENSDMVILKQQYTDEEQAFIDNLMKGV